MLGGVFHAFFQLFWPISLIISRGACEVEPQALAWVGCSKPSCFTRFWVGSVCGGPAGSWSRWVLLGALGGSWGPLGGETQPKHVPKAFAATGVCSQTFVKYEVFLNVGTPGVQNYSKMHVCVFSAGAQRPDQGHGHSEASFRSCFAVAGGRPLEHQSAKHDKPGSFPRYFQAFANRWRHLSIEIDSFRPVVRGSLAIRYSDLSGFRLRNSDEYSKVCKRALSPKILPFLANLDPTVCPESCFAS